MIKAKKASLLQRAVIEIGRYSALAGSLLSGAGCASSFNPSPTEVTKQKYLHENPFNYPFNYSAELDYKCKKYSEQGKPLEDISTRLGWGLAVANDLIEYPITAAFGVFGNGGKNFSKYFFDGLPGGRTNNEFHDRILSLNLGGAIKVPYEAEDSALGGTIKLAEIIGADFGLAYLFFGGNGDHHAAAAPAGPGPTPADPF